jgi:hypothetical protein
MDASSKTLAVARLRPPAWFLGDVSLEPQIPLPDALVGNSDASVGQDQLNVRRLRLKTA